MIKKIISIMLLSLMLAVSVCAAEADNNAVGEGPNFSEGMPGNRGGRGDMPGRPGGREQDGQPPEPPDMERGNDSTAENNAVPQQPTENNGAENKTSESNDMNNNRSEKNDTEEKSPKMPDRGHFDIPEPNGGTDENTQKVPEVSASAEAEASQGFIGFVTEYATPIISLILLALAFVFVYFYKRKKF